MDRIFFHLDVNSAFLSWSAAYLVNVLGERTDLRQIPSVVGGAEEDRHGIVLAGSIPAKHCGIRTGQTLYEAMKRCPDLVVIPPDYALYEKASRAFLEKLRTYSDRVFPYSIDEAWMEYTGLEGLWGEPEVFAERLKEEIRRELGFTVNIGISVNRLLSKMAGGFQKPDRVHTLYPDELASKLWPLPVEELFWVGPATASRLNRLGILTIGELAHADPDMLRAVLKKQGEIIQGYANGRELEPYLFAEQPAKGYGNSMTAPADVTDRRTASLLLLSLCETVGMRLREDGAQVSCVQVELVTSQFLRASRQGQLMEPTDVTRELGDKAQELLSDLWNGRQPLRKLGVHAYGARQIVGRQFCLFERHRYDRFGQAERSVDAVRKKYGMDCVKRACFLEADCRIPHMGGGPFTKF